MPRYNLVQPEDITPRTISIPVWVVDHRSNWYSAYITVAFTVTPMPNEYVAVGFAFAYCSPHDKFNHETGSHIATDRYRISYLEANGTIIIPRDTYLEHAESDSFWVHLAHLSRYKPRSWSRIYARNEDA